MANNAYDNYFLSNEVEDQYQSRLDLIKFCKVDNSLTGGAGMKRIVHIYKATDGTQIVEENQGNTNKIEVTFSQREYNIKCAQNHFFYTDEQEMKDPMVVIVGMQHAGVDMFNTVNNDIYGEFKKATMVVPVTKFDFAAFADAQSMFQSESLEGITQFAFVNPADIAALRKELKDTLQYVTEFATNGYVGSVAGVHIYTKRDADAGTIVIAMNDAVTLFNKKGVEVEIADRSVDEANKRQNNIFTRKYYVAALTDETHAVKIVKETATATSDTTVNASKTYYAKAGLGYVAVTPVAGDNPSSKGWYEIAA